MNVYLDDIRLPIMSHNELKGLGETYSSENNWIIIRNYFEFNRFIHVNFDQIKLISFDHDLACYKDGREFTGKDAAIAVINFCLDNDKSFPDWYVHTDNTVGRANIISEISNYLKVIEGKDISNMRYFHNGMINNKFI